jgi:hypothetical protein
MQSVESRPRYHLSPRNFTVPGASPFQASAALWGLRGEAGEEVRANFTLTNLEWASVGVPTGPAGVVSSGDADLFEITIGHMPTHHLV